MTWDHRPWTPYQALLWPWDRSTDLHLAAMHRVLCVPPACVGVGGNIHGSEVLISNLLR